MSNRFHLAIPAGDLDTAIKFYCDILGCEKGNSESKPWPGAPDCWVDINFWGNELTLHATNPNEKQIGKQHDVDMDNVSVPHFGVHLDAETFKNIKEKLIKNNVKFVNKPYIRFKNDILEQETMFVADPHGNVLEIKTMKNPNALFASGSYDVYDTLPSDVEPEESR